MICCLSLLAVWLFTGCGDKAAVSSAEEEQESAVSRIVGTWREDGEFGINVLVIEEDGTYVLYQTSGSTEQGTIKTDGDIHSEAPRMHGSAFTTSRESY